MSALTEISIWKEERQDIEDRLADIEQERADLVADLEEVEEKLGERA